MPPWPLCCWPVSLCLSLAVQKPLSKPSSWWKEVDWGSVLFFLVVAPGVVIVSSAVQKQLMIQLGVKKR